jgi:hypothetical protein
MQIYGRRIRSMSMTMTRRKRTVKEQREREDMQAQLEKQQATLEYVAAMADIDLPVEEATEGTDIDDEEEA